MLDLRHLADLDSRDAHRRVEPDVVDRLEHSLDLELLLPRERLAEREEGRDDDDDYRDQSRPHRVDPALEPPYDDALAWLCRTGFHQLPEVFTRGVVSVWVPWLPGMLPITVLPAANFSFPASHSRTWPGPAVFGYGLV